MWSRTIYYQNYSPELKRLRTEITTITIIKWYFVCNILSNIIVSFNLVHDSN